jgi:hypothetical protein
MLINYVFNVIIQIFGVRMVYYTMFGNISENWNKIIKIRDSIDTFMVASVKFQAKEKRNMYNESSLLWFGM